MKQIIVEKNIPVNNNELADKNRKLLDEKQIFTINLLGSPGSGKTCLLEKLIENIKTNTRRYAKRQLTWFNRYNNGIYYSPNDEKKIIEHIELLTNKKN